jgi:Mitochondrial K+-H+ exchange-related
MDVFLLPKKKGYRLYAPEPEPLEADKGQGDGGVVDTARRVYRATTAKSRRTERLLRELGERETLRVVHSSALSESRAREIYEGLVEAEVRKHKRWLWVDGAAIPFSALLTLVPGPNVVLAYLAWRTVAHYKGKKAGEKAAEAEVRFLEDEKLRELERLVRQPICFGRVRKIRALGESMGLAALDRAY